MQFLIWAIDKPDCEHIRDKLRPTRIAWLDANKARLLAAGGLVDDGNRHVRGGLMLVEADTREEAERFAAEDPFTPAGLYDKLEVIRWRRVFFDRERVRTPDPFAPD
jgi:uncharacterized protein YciI